MPPFCDVFLIFPPPSAPRLFWESFNFMMIRKCNKLLEQTFRHIFDEKEMKSFLLPPIDFFVEYDCYAPCQFSYILFECLFQLY